MRLYIQWRHSYTRSFSFTLPDFQPFNSFIQPVMLKMTNVTKNEATKWRHSYTRSFSFTLPNIHPFHSVSHTHIQSQLDLGVWRGCDDSRRGIWCEKEDRRGSSRLRPGVIGSGLRALEGDLVRGEDDGANGGGARNCGRSKVGGGLIEVCASSPASLLRWSSEERTNRETTRRISEWKSSLCDGWTFLALLWQ